MAGKKNRWKDHGMSWEVKVLDNWGGLQLKGVTPEDLDDLADCTRIKELKFTSSRGGPIDLEKITHIEWLECLYLDRVKVESLAPLRKFPRLHHVVIDNSKLPDLEALSGFDGLRSLVLRDNKLKEFPENFSLPDLRSILISGSPISDLSFVSSFPNLEWFDMRDTQVEDLAPLAACAELEKIEISRVPVTDFSPLASLKKLRKCQLDEDDMEAARALGVRGLDGSLRKPKDPAVQARRKLLFETFVAGDAEALNAMDYDPDIGRHFGWYLSSFHSRGPLEAKRPALLKVLEGVDLPILIDALAGSMGMLQTSIIQFSLDLFAGIPARLPDAALGAFDVILAKEGLISDFESGLMKNDHWNLARLMSKVAAPEFAPVYQRFFDERERFNEFARVAYSELLNSVTKTKDASLVPSIIDLTRVEKKIIGGDGPFLKKCFKATKTLGDASHLELLRSTFDVSSEGRADVLKAFDETVARLEKKAPK
ncbi:MAG: hypothetical protein QNI86_02730 [Halieaceae bacterium]|nr:hypothetical protein [Halieaceae bacterium]